jgi:CRISPR-associated protein Cmr5
MNQTLAQQRARFAMDFIKKTSTVPAKEEKAKYLTLIHKAPTMILQNGLGQLLAFWLADNEGKTDEKRKKPSGVLYDLLEAWLCGTNEDNSHPLRIYEKKDLIGELMQGSRNDYMRAQQEALALLGWMKKFAEAWLS